MYIHTTCQNDRPKSTKTVIPSITSSLQVSLYAPQNWQNCASKGCTVLPELAETGSQNCSQNWAVLVARTGARTAQFWQPETAARAAVLARTVLSKLAAQFSRTRHFRQIPQPELPQWLCICISHAPEKKSGGTGNSGYMLPGLYREHPKIYLHGEASQDMSYRSTPFCGNKE